MEGRKKPDRCPSRDCRKRSWDRGEVPNPPVSLARMTVTPIKPIPSLPAGVSLGMPAALPPMADIRMCPYKEYDPDLGEWFACGRPVHDYKVKHTRGRKL